MEISEHESGRSSQGWLKSGHQITNIQTEPVLFSVSLRPDHLQQRGLTFLASLPNTSARMFLCGISPWSHLMFDARTEASPASQSGVSNATWGFKVDKSPRKDLLRHSAPNPSNSISCPVFKTNGKNFGGTYTKSATPVLSSQRLSTKDRPMIWRTSRTFPWPRFCIICMTSLSCLAEWPWYTSISN